MWLPQHVVFTDFSDVELLLMKMSGMDVLWKMLFMHAVLFLGFYLNVGCCYRTTEGTVYK